MSAASVAKTRIQAKASEKLCKESSPPQKRLSQRGAALTAIPLMAQA
eukprot:CAMPEP_0117569282 /NCGR_PEP_ID=MMETSP0784-20121206/58577_1 /TAXON_ID=39447 /ORGANISM="" /LENGTH=46 /DNA_ID= /DNA_START= /DNA_END= /DNA_ORIENTATION=